MNDPSVSFDTVANFVLSVKKKDGKLGMINALGKWVVSPEYIELGGINENSRKPYTTEWDNGVLIVKKASGYGAINALGKEIIPCVYKDRPLFANQVFYLTDNTGKHALADMKGNFLTKFTTAYPSTFVNGLKTVDLSKKYKDENLTQSCALISKTGDTLLRLKNAKYRFSILGSSEGMTAFVMYPVIYNRTEGGIGFLDETGKVAIPPVYSSKELKDTKVTLPWWDYKPAFHHGLALVLKGDSSIYIDKTGKEIINFRNRPGKVVARNDFSVDGFAQIQYYFKENGRTLRYTELIDTAGAVVLQIKNDGHIGEDGIEYVDFRTYENFLVVKNEGKTLYNSKVEKLFFQPRSDDNYNYFSRTNEIGTCLVKEEKLTEKAEYTYLDNKGKQLRPYRPVEIYFDPLTNITISMKGTVTEMKNAFEEVIYACDSCLSMDLNRLKNYRNGLPHNISGVYEIHVGREVLFVNYKGVVIEQFPSKEEVVTRFMNISKEQKVYNTVPSQQKVLIKVKQSELDEIYNNMPWTPQNRAKSGTR